MVNIINYSTITLLILGCRSENIWPIILFYLTLAKSPCYSNISDFMLTTLNLASNFLLHRLKTNNFCFHSQHLRRKTFIAELSTTPFPITGTSHHLFNSTDHRVVHVIRSLPSVNIQSDWTLSLEWPYSTRLFLIFFTLSRLTAKK